jgi:hypothetical protein
MTEQPRKKVLSQILCRERDETGKLEPIEQFNTNLQNEINNDWQIVTSAYDSQGEFTQVMLFKLISMNDGKKKTAEGHQAIETIQTPVA